jgi:L-arabinokinase
VAALCFYISGHGFGHASRQIEIINAVGAASPATPIVIRTSAPGWLFARTLRVSARVLPGECDTGVLQLDSLRPDIPGTIQRAADFHRTAGDRARAEAEMLRAHEVAFVIADAPPIACAAASAAGIPSVVVSNFTWDWIYENYVPEIRQAPDLLDTLRTAYALTGAGWRLPLYGGFETIGRRVDVPFVARHARHQRRAVRETCGLPPDARIALLSFGGYGLNSIDLSRLDCLDRYIVLTTHGGSPPRVPAGVTTLAEADLYDADLRYEDLVAAVDVVMTKPGYGIVSECIANDTALLYTSRGRFAEYDVMVAEMPRYLRCGFIDQRSLFAGRWAAALDDVLSAAPPPERPRTDGAPVIAQMILENI